MSASLLSPIRDQLKNGDIDGRVRVGHETEAPIVAGSRGGPSAKTPHENARRSTSPTAMPRSASSAHRRASTSPGIIDRARRFPDSHRPPPVGERVRVRSSSGGLAGGRGMRRGGRRGNASGRRFDRRRSPPVPARRPSALVSGGIRRGCKHLDVSAPPDRRRTKEKRFEEAAAVAPSPTSSSTRRSAKARVAGLAGRGRSPGRRRAEDGACISLQRRRRARDRSGATATIDGARGQRYF